MLSDVAMSAATAHSAASKATSKSASSNSTSGFSGKASHHKLAILGCLTYTLVLNIYAVLNT